jgi:hypothetical protein
MVTPSSVLCRPVAVAVTAGVPALGRGRGCALRREYRLPRLLQGIVTVDVHIERRGGDAQAVGPLYARWWSGHSSPPSLSVVLPWSSSVAGHRDVRGRGRSQTGPCAFPRSTDLKFGQCRKIPNTRRPLAVVVSICPPHRLKL